MPPGRLTSWVPTTTYPTFNYNLADLVITDENNVMYTGATLTSSDDPAGMCFNGNCFLATVETRNL